jgi:fructuronate reductase
VNILPLNRANLKERGGDVCAPIRIVHLGLGAFHRAHQAWYTAQAPDAADWGIAAFTGRSPKQAQVLNAQDGLYTLTERDSNDDHVSVITSIVEAVDGARIDRLIELLSDPDVAIVTLTITENGYRLGSDGLIDPHDPVLAQDIAALRAAWAGDLSTAAPEAALTRLLAGLEARRRAGGATIAVVPCDNLPGNGPLTARALHDLARELDADLAQWIDDSLSFVSTSVDRITPRVDDPPTAAIAAAGWSDNSPVIAEPFTDWVLSGSFPAGRPRWEEVGASFVDDIDPWENRKLWLLNGAHSLLAYTGMPAGHRTVSAAIADPLCRAVVEEFWAEAAALIPADVDTDEYRDSLVARFSNSRIDHPLEQIATDARVKTRVRLAAVAERTRAAGGTASASAAAIAAWIRWVDAGHSSEPTSEDVDRAVTRDDRVTRLVGLVSPTLATDPQFLSRVQHFVTSTQKDPHAQASAVSNP